MISRQFIDRPLLACVVSIFIVIAGLAALRSLAISLYPDILPPMVEVVTSYPGASSDVVAKSVSAPLEQQLNGTEDMLYLSSSSMPNATSAAFRAARTLPQLSTSVLSQSKRTANGRPALTRPCRPAPPYAGNRPHAA